MTNGYIPRALVSQVKPFVHPGVVILLGTLLAVSFFFGSLNASASRGPAGSSPRRESNSMGVKKVNRKTGVQVERSLRARPRSSGTNRLSALTFLAPLAPGLQTYADDCSTVPVSFTLGQAICVNVTGVTDLRLAFIDPGGFIRDTRQITASPQQETFTLPSTETDLIAGFFTTQNRGTWRINLINSDGSVAFFSEINVKETGSPAADVSIVKGLVSSNVPSGSSQDVVYDVVVQNYGPDDAANVQFTDDTPSNTTFTSLTQLSGPTFSCTPPAVGSPGTTTCTIATLPWNGNDTAVFEFVYTSSSSTGVIQGGDVNVSSTTPDITTDNNSGGGPVFGIGNTTPPSCTLDCPSNVSAVADTTEDVNGVPTSGAHVTFADATTTGTCGTLTASPSSGSFFPVGSTPVTVTSSQGGECSFVVTVTASGSAVTISCPANIVANADSNCQATVTLGTPTTTGDNVTVVGSRNDGKPMYDCDVNGENCVRKSVDLPFSVGVNTVTWSASNSSGTATCHQTVTVYDVTPPTFNITNQTASADANCQAAVPDFSTIAVASDNCACASSDTSEICDSRHDIAITQDVAAGTVLGLGPHTINLTANDGSITPGPDGIIGTPDDIQGNSTTVAVTFTVVDTTAPSFIFVPPAVTAYTGAGATTCDTVVSDATLGTPTATDNCSAVTITRSPSGNTFPVGTTTVVWTAKDVANNAATANQSVTVIDNTLPVVTAPANVTAYTGPGATSCGTVVSDATLGSASASDNCPGIGAISRTGVPSGNVFPLGTTTITYSVTDAHGNSSSNTQTVTVIDNTPPVISCPSNIVLEPTCPSGAVGTYTPPVGTDNCAGVTTTRTAGLASGSVFPIGTSTVTYTANDAHGNSTSCSFTVTVKTVSQTIGDLMTSVNSSSLSGTQKQGLIAKLQAALDALGQGHTSTACQKLADFINSTQTYIDHGNISAAVGNAWNSTAAHVRNTLGCTNNPCT